MRCHGCAQILPKFIQFIFFLEKYLVMEKKKPLSIKLPQFPIPRDLQNVLKGKINEHKNCNSLLYKIKNKDIKN